MPKHYISIVVMLVACVCSFVLFQYASYDKRGDIPSNPVLENPNEQDATYTDKDVFDDKGRYRFTGKHATICDFSKKERSFRLKAANKTYRFSIPYHYIRSAPMRHGQITNYLRLSAIHDTFESRCVAERRDGLEKYSNEMFNLMAVNQIGNPLRRHPSRSLLIKDDKFPGFDIFRSTAKDIPIYHEYFEHKGEGKNVGQRIECKRVSHTNEVGYCKIRFFYAENLMLEAYFHSNLLNDVDKVKSYAVNLLNKFKVK